MKKAHRRKSKNETDWKENNEWKIPTPPAVIPRRRERGIFNDSTPLLPMRQRSRPASSTYQHDSVYQKNPLVLQPNGPDKTTMRKPTTTTSVTGHDEFHEKLSTRNRMVADTSMETLQTSVMDGYERSRPTGLAGFFFGFMYEEPFEESFMDYGGADVLEERTVHQSIWNPLNMALFATYTLTTTAATLPILLIPTIGKELGHDDESSGFASRAAASAVLGTACGKFLNGPLGDVLGARRTSFIFACLLALALVSLSFCNSIHTVTRACFFVEFFQSVQWPCILIILATHYGPQQQSAKSDHAMYEGGIYMTSIASRFGSLLGIPFFSSFLHDSQWRWVCFMGAWLAMIGASVTYLLLADSPKHVNEPQNPLHPTLLCQLSDVPMELHRVLVLSRHVVHSLIIDNLIPSLKHVLRSGTFWIVALAHTGSSTIRTSERILTTYFHDTSEGFLSQDKASGLSIFSSLGTILGLGICGTYFTSLSQERDRKRFVSRLYVVAIASCYTLALFAIPTVYEAIDAPGLILFFQIFASFCMSLAIAVMLYQIPGLVSSTFGNHKGLFCAYVDGVAYGVASVIWKIVASSVSQNSAGAGWAYGWAAVALLLVLCSILMVEFMEHYFVRPSQRQGSGAYETIILA